MDREVILRALDEQRVLRIEYRGGAARTIQPHALVKKPDGTELLQAFQVRGHSEGGAEHGWKTFDLAHLDRVDLLDEHFEPRRDFRPVSGQSARV
ncbi:MAG: WYL domain-containing protein [Gemmatimonadaceae bacterium]